MNQQRKQQSSARHSGRGNQGRNQRGQQNRNGVSWDRFFNACNHFKKKFDPKERGHWPSLEDIEADPTYFMDHCEDLFGWYAANHSALAKEDFSDQQAMIEAVKILHQLSHDLSITFERTFEETFDWINWQENDPESFHGVEALSERYFSRNSGYVMAFFDWFFGKETKNLDTTANLSHEDRKPTGQDRGGRGGRDNGRGGRDRGDGRRGFSRDRKGGRAPFKQPPPDPAQEAEVLKQCDEAMEILKQNPERKAIALNPQNSFYRRLQHQHIFDAGFNSRSIGEGQERAVIVERLSADNQKTEEEAPAPR